MKLKKIMIILFSILAILITTFLIYTLLKNYMISQIPPDENIQVAVLEEVYRDFLSNQDLSSCTISLDDSALLNLITNEKFCDSSIEDLKSITKRYKGTKTKYTLYSAYNNGILKLTLYEESISLNTYCYECTSTYKLIYNGEKMSYIKKGNDIITYHEKLKISF